MISKNYEKWIFFKIVVHKIKYSLSFIESVSIVREIVSSSVSNWVLIISIEWKSNYFGYCESIINLSGEYSVILKSFTSSLFITF